MEESEDWEEDMEKRWKEYEKRWEEWAEELSRRIGDSMDRIGDSVERALSKSLKAAAKGPRVLMYDVAPHRMREKRFRRPIPIRNLDRELYRSMRDLAEERGVKTGEIINEAMRYYLEHADPATLEKEKKGLLKRLENVSTDQAMDEDIRKALEQEYTQMLNEVKQRIEKLKKEKEELRKEKEELKKEEKEGEGGGRK